MFRVCFTSSPVTTPKSENREIGFLLAIVALFFAALACTGTQQLGRLSLGAEPITFTLLGEVSHSWQVDVEPNQNYVVIVQTENSSHPLNQLQILIQQADESRITFIGESVRYADNAASTTFTTPSRGVISIIVSSKIGENGADLGTFTIQLLKESS